MPDIRALSSDVQRLSGSVDFWNKFILLLLIGAAMAAAGLVFATHKSIQQAKLLSQAQDRLLAAKELETSQRISDNELESARLRETAERERLARVRLENKVAWRTLEPDQQRELENKLSSFREQLVDCSFLSGDMEAFSFSADIATALRSAKWRVVPPNPNVLQIRETSLPTTATPIESIDFGVDVASTSDTKSIGAAHAIVDELNRLGFDATYDASPQNPKQPAVWVIVQHRPLGAQGKAKLGKQ